MLTIAWFLSLIMGEVAIPLARTWLPAENIVWMSASSVYSLHTLVYLGTLLLCTPLLILPVWRVRRVSLIRLIQFNRGKHIFRSLMIGVQLAVCVFFLGAVMVVHLSYTELFGKHMFLWIRRKKNGAFLFLWIRNVFANIGVKFVQAWLLCLKLNVWSHWGMKL